jgi:uncharacterized protein YacL
MEQFLNEVFGDTPLSIQLAWYVIGFIGAVFGFLVREYSNLKSHPFTVKQMIIGFITAFIFIRFGKQLTELEPTAFGALLIGISFNELALKIVNSKPSKTD